MRASKKAPAASVGPSSPSVPPERKATSRAPSSQKVSSAARASCWFRPPCPRRDASTSRTTGSPPLIRQSGPGPVAHVPGHGGQVAADFFRRTFRLPGADHGVGITPPLGFHSRRVDSRGIVADHEVRHLAGGQAVSLKVAAAGATGRRRRNAGLASGKLPEHGQRSFCRGAVFHGRAGSDHVQRIAEHVGNDERNQPSRAARPGKPSALDPAELLADRIELLDVRPGRAEVPRNGQLVVQGDCFHRAPAAGPNRRRRAGRGRNRPP